MPADPVRLHREGLLGAARRAGRTSAVALCVALLGVACRHLTKEPVESDLVAAFRYTESGQNTTEVDFGSAQAEPYLGAGWSAAETAPTGESVARAVERKAIVKLGVAEPAERVLAVRCAAAHLPTKRPPTIIVRVNDRRAGTFTVQTEMAEHRIVLPAALLRPGENEVAFCTRLGHGDERLDVSYDTLRLLSASGDAATAPRLDGDAVVVPGASSVAYFLRLPEDPVLRFGMADGGGHGRVAVSVQRDGEAARRVVTRDAPAAPADVALGAAGIARVAFENDGTDAVRVIAPRLRGFDWAPEGRGPAEQGRGYNVLLYVIDTLRADHLGTYGYARPTSPQLDAFGRSGVVFENTVSQASWTRPATASILTGRYPAEHGATTLRNGLRPNVATLAELLHQQGYDTGAFVTNVNVAPQWGFRRGFDLYQYLPEDEHSPTVHVRSDVMNAAAVEWLNVHRDHPFFLYLHDTDPHAPYTPSAPWDARLADPAVHVAPERVGGLLRDFRVSGVPPSADEVRALMARYDGEIAFTDDNFGHLLAVLQRLGVADRTLVIVVADHGEEFLDHGGLEHGRTLFQEMVHVPLLMRFPNRWAAGTRVTTTARQIDIVPTVLDYLGVSSPADLPGRSLLPAAAGVAMPPVDALAETNLGRQGTAGVVTGDWKIVQGKSLGANHTSVYNLKNDPGERIDRAEEQPLLLGYARQVLAAEGGSAARRGEKSGVEPAADPAIMERLRALGYTD